MNSVDQFIAIQAEKIEPVISSKDIEYMLKRAHLDESRPLTGTFSDYVTQDTEPRYKCDIVEVDYTKTPEFIHKTGQTLGIDIDQFRKDCDEIDEDKSL